MYYEINGLKLNFRIYGEGKPVFMIHGFRTDSRVMIGAFEPIFKKISGYKRIYIDLPGMGKSDINIKYSGKLGT
ncbi:MAG: alpha/beta fold hydrolase [Candidatus Odinarchaeia archaeon]